MRFGNDLAVHFVGAVVDPAAAGHHRHVGERRLVGQPLRSVHLDRPVDDVVQDLRREELDRRDLDPGLRAVVDLVRRIECHQPARLDLDVTVGDPVLDGLLARQRFAERLPLERIAAHQVERALHLREPAHHVVDTTGAETLLGDQEPSAFCAERVRRRHADVRVPHLTVGRPAPPRVSHDGHGPDDVDARSVGRDDDLRRPRVRVGVGIGDGHDDPERSAVGARRKPLVAVDHPVVAVAHGPRTERRRVRARHLGLGHREEGADAAADQRVEPAVLLLVRAEHVQDLRVARVGRLAAEDQLPPDGETDLFVQIRVVEEPGAGAARLGRHVRRPETELPHLVTESRDEGVRFVVFLVEQVLVRKHALVHERAHLCKPRGGRGEGRSGHCHSIAEE